MNDFINKFTIYDLIANIIPGFMVVFTFCLAIPEKISKFLQLIDNSIILLILIFGSISYCIGWIISEAIKLFHRLVMKKDKKDDKKKESIKIFVLRLGIFILCITLLIIALENYKFGILIILYTIFLYLVKKINYKSDNNKEIDVYSSLLKECYRLLKLFHPNLDIWENEKQDITNITEKFGEYANFLIQSEPKYGRVHNFNSSKSFSKNLSGSCLIISIISSYFFITENNINYQIFNVLAIIISLLSFFILYERYKMFERKTNMIVLSYFIDYLMNRIKDEEISNDNEIIIIENNIGE